MSQCHEADWGIGREERRERASSGRRPAHMITTRIVWMINIPARTPGSPKCRTSG